MTKESTCVSGADLVAALERVARVMKSEVERNPELAYVVATGGLNPVPSLAVVFTFDPKTMRHTDTKICSEKRAAKAWIKAKGINI